MRAIKIVYRLGVLSILSLIKYPNSKRNVMDLGSLHATIKDTSVSLGVQQFTDSRVVVVGHFSHLELGIDGHLHRVQARLQLGDVHPLAVDIVPVDIVAIDADACQNLHILHFE